MASLFGRNKLRERADLAPEAPIQEALEIVQQWRTDYHSGSLKRDKETSREQAYNRDFFIRILGYREKPHAPHTFEPKATTEKRQLPDAIVGIEGPDSSFRTFAVVELKSAATSLDRPQSREGNLSPVQQGFKYKTQYRSCPFVVVSNFWEFRLYNDNQLDFESWTLDDLVDPSENHLKLRTFYALLHADNMVCVRGQSPTQQLLSDIRINQEEIGRDFYRVYKEARLTLLRSLYISNESVRNDIERGIEKAQKVIDRIVFTCFAEDRGLLPDNTVDRVVSYADNAAFDVTLWHTLKGFFEAVNSGSRRLEIPSGYNGGLFADDPELNSLEIPDSALRPVLNLSKYNFAEDLSVNILGHIFEQSINDLEDIRNKVHASHSVPATVDEEVKSIGRRKRDGIFYTPDYIVRYIVDNTVGKYLREQEERCAVQYGLKSDIKDRTYERRERQAYLKYQNILQSICILDPACGSGAFLVHVFDYLLGENQRVDAILGGSLVSLDEYVRDILRNNIFGVDVNEESVEITKLSLWLKTAQRGKKLTTLDTSILCGNSLVDDVRIAGDKAFDWHSKFSSVMSAGGFDIVLGNPPYVRSRDNVLDDIRDYVQKHYTNLHDKANLYLLFMEQSLRLLKSGGFLGFVVPNSWLGMDSAEKTRRMLLESTTLERIVSMTGESFEHVSVEAVILVCTKRAASDSSEVLYQTVSSPAIEPLDYRRVRQARWRSTPKMIFDVKSGTEDFDLMDLLSSTESRVSDYYLVRVGLQAYERGRGTPAQTAADVKNHPFDYRYKYDDDTYPYLEGRDVGRYGIQWSGQWLRHGEWLSQPKELDLFSGPRILVREITGHYPEVLYATYLEDTYLNNKSILNVSSRRDEYSLKFLLGLLNSSVISFFHQRRAAKGNRTLFPKVVANDLKNYPILVGDAAARHEIEAEVEGALFSQARLQNLSSKFQTLVSHELTLNAWPRKLTQWWSLEVDDFLDAVPGQHSLRSKGEVLDLLAAYGPECVAHEKKRQSHEATVDSLVCDLLGLSLAHRALLRAANPALASA